MLTKTRLCQVTCRFSTVLTIASGRVGVKCSNDCCGEEKLGGVDVNRCDTHYRNDRETST